MNNTYILGGAQTDFARNWTKEGADFMVILREVVEQGLADLELDYAEISQLRDENRIGVFIANFNGERYFNQGHLGAFMTEVDPAFYGVPGARYEAACASGSVALNAARAKIAAGDIDLALVVGLEVMKTVNPAVGNDFLGYAAVYEREAKGVRFVFPRIFGTLADEIIARNPEVGAERIMSCLSEVSKTNYTNAKNNPLAQTRGHDLASLPKFDEKYKTTFGGRTRYSDCSQVTDGAALTALASPEFTRRFLEKRGRPLEQAAELAGWGHVVAPVGLAEKLHYSRGEKNLVPFTRQCVIDAYQRAGISVDDIDVFETHDCFTSSEYLALSAFGITDAGEEYQAIEQGWIRPEGKTPVNPSGGLIGLGHPVGATGVRMMLDLYRQVSGGAGGYQVDGAKTAVCLNIGGSFTTNFSFVVKRPEGG